MPVSRPDPRIERVVALLPSDGSAISHVAWRQAVIEQGDLSLLAATQNARRAAKVIFEIGNPDDPAGSLTVRRAFIAAAPAQAMPQAARPAPVAPPPPTTPNTGGA